MTDPDTRYRERVDFEVSAEFVTGSKTYFGTCENISMSGVLLNLDRFFSVGETGSIIINLRSGSEFLEVKSSCVIARVVPNGDSFQIGLQFEDLDSESSIVLYNIVRYQTV